MISKNVIGILKSKVMEDINILLDFIENEIQAKNGIFSGIDKNAIINCIEKSGTAFQMSLIKRILNCREKRRTR